MSERVGSSSFVQNNIFNPPNDLRLLYFGIVLFLISSLLEMWAEVSKFAVFFQWIGIILILFTLEKMIFKGSLIAALEKYMPLKQVSETPPANGTGNGT